MERDEDKERRWGNLVLWGPFAPITAADLDEVERAIGRPLPRDYRGFLEAAHGGTVQYAVRLPPDDPDGDWLEFSELFTAVGEGPGTLIGEWRSSPRNYFARFLPAPVLPVANDGGGSVLLLDLREETHGQVWAYVHGLPPWAGGDARNSGGLVAESWTEYLSMLTVNEELARDIWEDARDGAEPGWLPSVVHWLDAGLPGWRSLPWAGNVPGTQ
jgi:cell wall assembly regulator SMI1